jgi:flagellar motility protein MotE (MotC chaperone)
MKFGPPRLLPVVIAAAAALLLFKGIGLVTEGGYALVGPVPAFAAGKAKPAEHSAEGGGGGDEALGDHSMADQDPTLEDTSVTMELPSGDAAAPAEGGGHGSTPKVGPEEAAVTAEACPPTEAADAAHGAEADPAAEAHGSAEAEPAGHGAEPAAESTSADPCLPDPGVNEYGDALPLVKDNASGTMVPLSDTLTDASSEAAINDRLSERRALLEQREKELDMRSTLLDAAERRIDERSAELKALEEKIAKLVDDNKTAEQQQFVSLVAMYENMKPKDAATIFNELDMPVLLGVAKAMNPRKMAPILARMNPLKAKALTDGIATADTPAEVAAGPAPPDLTNLPQIVGQ